MTFRIEILITSVNILQLPKVIQLCLVFNLNSSILYNSNMNLTVE